MTIQRNIPAAVQSDLEQQHGEHAILAFMEIEHPGLDDTIRIVSDVMDYEWSGNTWAGVVFEFRTVQDDDQPPETQLVVQNVDRRIGEAILSMRERAQVSLYVLSSADFDLTKDPREPHGTPATIYNFSRFDLVNIEGNAIQISGRVMLRDYSQSPWPGVVATQSRAPAAA